jgi:hypothetical protein
MGKKLCPRCGGVWIWDSEILSVDPEIDRDYMPLAVCPECGLHCEEGEQ